MSENYSCNFESYACDFKSYTYDFESYAYNFESYAYNFESYACDFESYECDCSSKYQLPNLVTGKPGRPMPAKSHISEQPRQKSSYPLRPDVISREIAKQFSRLKIGMQSNGAIRSN